MWSLLVIVLLVALVVVAWFTPVLSVRKIAVTGNTAVPTEQVLDTLKIPKGQPLLRVDTEAAAHRVAQIPRVAKVRVQREFPSTIKVTVTERTPAVFFDSPQGPHLVDIEGVDFAIGPPPPGVPRLKVDSPGPNDPKTKAALTVLQALPVLLRGQVSEISVPSLSAVQVSLADGRVIAWGSSADSDRKAQVVAPLLTQPGRVYDVSSPDLPTIK
ncbi:FtsQ-type POTRA domain-containing protein [Skermania sp. ID1734]|nr:FtsQ-type POTRA domain-containing protein [Skermania sp. ID1734]